MASKSTRKTTLLTSVQAQSPQVTTSSSRPASPLSPTRISRLQEKEELQHLNDRLAAYIDRVRHLENENNRLQIQIQTYEENTTKEITSTKALFENELAEARRLLDDVAKEKAKIQIDCGKYKTDHDDLLLKFNRREKELATAEKNAAFNETRANDLQARLTQSNADRKRFEDENKELKADLEKLTKLHASTRQQLEHETLQRVDLENRVQTLKEDLSFRDQVHAKEITETRTRKQVEISEIDGHLQKEYEYKLAETLQELREQYETQMRLNREELENIYDAKFADQKRTSELQLKSATTSRDELLELKSRFSNVQSKLKELEALNASLTNRIKDLEQLLEEERQSHLTVLASKDDELKRLRDIMNDQLKDYEELMNIKVALDLEIAAYRKLLEGEEARLNITPTRLLQRTTGLLGQSRTTPVRRTPVRGGKRKRTFLSQSEEKASCNFTSTANAVGDIEIQEQDTEGKFIKLRNKGEQDINIGGWHLLRKAGEENNDHKFHRTTVVKAGETVTVWSMDSGVAHAPPSDLLMKGQKWFVAPSMTSHLINSAGEEVATRETFRQVMSSSSLHSSDTGDSNYEEIYHQQGDPQNPERCVLM